MADFADALHRYVGAVAAQWRIDAGLCVVDPGRPARAYIALALRLPRYPGRDLALLWDERTGWSLAVETNSGEDLILVAGVSDDNVLPSPSTVRQFVEHLTVRDDWIERRHPLFHRVAGGHDELADEMTGLLRRRDGGLLA